MPGKRYSRTFITRSRTHTDISFRDINIFQSGIARRRLRAMFNNYSLLSVYLCLVVLVETSSSLRQASSSWAKVLGGGRGGMAGSWMNGWAGWWLRRWPQLPPPPHVCVWVEEPPKDFLVLWLLRGRKEIRLHTLTTCNGGT